MQTETKKMGILSSLVIVFLAFGAFAGAAAIISQNQLSLAPVLLADEGSDDDGGDDDGDEDDEDEDEDDDEDKQEKEREKAKKESEKRAEKDRKAAQSSNRSEDEDDNDVDGDEDDSDDEDDADDADEMDDEEDDNRGMFKEKDKTLEKLRKEIAKAKEDVMEKQADGADVSVALARLALAEASIDQVGLSFDANDLETAKMLAKQVKKTAHFAEKDAKYAEKIADEMAKVKKRFGQVEKKIAVLVSVGGDATAYRAQLLSLRADYSALETSIASTPGVITRDTVKAFEKRVKRLKSVVESAIFAMGGTDDDDLFEDHEDDAEDLFEDLEDVAEIEDDDDDNDVSERVRKVASEHKAAGAAIKESLKNIKDRDGLARTLIGSDVDALAALNNQAAAMNTRATALETAAGKISDPDIKQILIDQAAALHNEVLKLQAFISAENSQTGIFGALLRMFR